MISDNIILNITVTTGIIFVIVGFIMLKFPPKRINTIYGYKTPSSMKSQDRWDFAQPYASRELIKFGAILSVLGLIASQISISVDTAKFIGGGLVLLAVIVLIVRVETAINKAFKTD